MPLTQQLFSKPFFYNSNFNIDEQNPIRRSSITITTSLAERRKNESNASKIQRNEW